MKILYILAALFMAVGCKDAPETSSKATTTQEVEKVTLVSTTEMQELLSDTNVQLVDVRTPEEFEVGHIINASNIDYKNAAFEKNIESLDKDKPVMVYCRSGRRSARSCEILREKGFTKVYDLSGGILQWQKEGKLINTPSN